jgi:chromodomain-helicase-DNA-binding protein 4
MFVGLIIERKKAAPCLVVVPNSTITSWVREFERWAPHLRVVPYHGEAKSREIVRRYELAHDETEAGYTKLKCHVLITTYETITNSRDFGPVFKQVPRWEALIVDEGQRRACFRVAAQDFGF